MVVGGMALRIGADVPGYKIHTVKLRMNPRQHAAYTLIHDQYAQALYKKRGKKDVRMLSISHRSLCQATLDPNLQRFEDRTLGKSPGDPAWAGQNSDHGAGYYCARTMPGHIPPLRDALGMALYNSALSVKLQYLAGLLKYLVIDYKERVPCASTNSMHKHSTRK